jgi:hypothetical protein
MYDAIQLIGWVGAASLLLAYGLLIGGKLAATGSTYLAINFIASIALGLRTAAAHAWPSTTVNALWLVIGLMPLARALRVRAERRNDAQRAGEAISPQRSTEVGKQVDDVFDSDREPHEVIANA